MEDKKGYTSIRVKTLLLFSLMGLVTITASSLLSYFGATNGIRSSVPRRASQLADQLAYSFDVFLDNTDPFLMQRLVEKTASFEDIALLMVTDQAGNIIAHNNQLMVGQHASSPLIEQVINENRVHQEILESKLIFLRPLHGKSYTPEFLDTTGVLWLELDFTRSIEESNQAIYTIVAVNTLLVSLIVGIAYQLTKKSITDRLLIIDKDINAVRSSALTATLFQESSTPAHNDEITSIATHFNQMLTDLDHRIAFEELITSISVEFSNISKKDLPESIQEALTKLAQFIDVDRGYIFEIDNEQVVMSNTFEWCAEGIHPEIENLQNLPVAIFPWWIKQLDLGKEVNIPNVENLPQEAENEKEILSEQNIQAVLVVPMRTEKTLLGFVGFDSVKRTRTWHPEEVRLLRLAGDIITNTTIRLETQKELQDQRDFAQLIMNSIGQGITVNTFYIEKGVGIFNYVNPAFSAMVGIPVQKLIGTSLSAYVLEEDLPMIKEALQERLQNKIASYQLRLVSRTTGNIINALITASPRVQNGVVVGSISVFTDLTEILAAKQALEESQTRMRAFLDAVPDMIFRITGNGIFLDFKTAETQKLLIPPEQFVGKTLQDVLPKNVAEATAYHIQKAIETNAAQIFSYDMNMDGTTYAYEARIVVSGENEVIAVIHDITEQTRLEQMKTDFINRASHELRTPLTTSLLMADLLDDIFKGNDDDNAQYWKVLKEQLGRQRELLEDLLTLGRLESGRYQEEIQQIWLLPLLHKTITEILPQMALKEIKPVLNFPKEVSATVGSNESLQRVFTNLLNNAIKFSPRGKNIYIDVSELENSVQVTVRDEGIGIPSEDLPHIAGRFFRASNASKYEIQGSGIGLYIVKSIVEGFGGRFILKSTENKETIAIVELSKANTS
ncbi:MAG: PAS domain S-box protein [Anaerolineae bacterium]|nr:PAS domain S-box protein [Anaerolineae bacterium]